MKVGVPRERKAGEKRVAITPDGVSVLKDAQTEVIVEQGAGGGAGFGDDDYQAAGATVVGSLAEVWQNCDLLVKVKEPAPEEVPFFRPGLTVFSFLHLAPQPELTKQMVSSGVTGLDYDLVQLDDGSLPILEPMSVIAGKLSIQCGAFALQSSNEGRGILLGGVPGVRPAKIVVIGAGAAGASAARAALGAGAEVTILDINLKKLTPFIDGHLRARTLYSTPQTLLRELRDADMVIGSVLIPGALAPKLITRPMLPEMPLGAVLVDICIDQGGVSESSRPTTIQTPTYVESGVVHYCVPNMPALVPRTSTDALTNATLPWLRLIKKHGIEGALKFSRPLARSLTSYKGRLTNALVGEAVGIESVDPESVIATL